MRSPSLVAGRPAAASIICSKRPVTRRLVPRTAAAAAQATTAPLTKEDLVSYLASGCKPKQDWRYVFFWL